jgi:hypothetical protein
MSDPRTAPAAQPETLPTTPGPRPAPQSSPVQALAVVNVLLAVVYVFYGTFLLLGAVLFSSNIAVMGRQTGAPSRDLLFSFVALTYGLALALIVAGIGLKKRRPWGRALTLILGALFAVVALLSVRQRDLLSIALNGIYSAEVFVILLNRRLAGEFAPPASQAPSA